MKNIWRFIRKSFYLQLVFIFIVLIIPLYFMSYSFYSLGSQTIINGELGNRQRDLDYSMKTLDEELGRVLLLQFDFIHSDEMNLIHNFGNENFSYNAKNHITSFRDKLFATQNGSVLVEELIAFFPNLDRSISSRTGYEYFSGSEWLAQVAEKSQYQTEPYVENGRLLIDREYPVMNLARPHTPFYGIRVILSTKAIQNKFSQFDSVLPHGAFLTYGEGGEEKIFIEDHLALAESMRCSVKRDTLSSENMITLEKENYYILISESQKTPLKAYHYVQEGEIFALLASGRRKITVFTLLACLLVIAFITYLYRAVQKPVDTLVHAFQEVDKGNLAYQIESEKLDEFGYLFTNFNLMIVSVNNLIDINYSQVLMLKEAELSQLQSQINPHFLYNSFFILHRLIKSEDWVNATEFSKNLGTYFSYITKSSAAVCLADDFKHALAYANIQGKRFEGIVEIVVEPLPCEFESLLVPKLILQPIIENAFEHVFSNRFGRGQLQVRFEQYDASLLIHFDDNGSDITEEAITEIQDLAFRQQAKSDKIGLNNIHRRLKLYFGDSSGLTFSQSSLGGLRVTITLYKKEMPNDTSVDC